MPITYLKKAEKTPESETSNAQDVVTEMLASIEKDGEDAVRAYAKKLDNWDGEILVTPDAMNKRIASVPDTVKADIEFATEQVRRFAIAQRDSIQELRPKSVQV